MTSSSDLVNRKERQEGAKYTKEYYELEVKTTSPSYFGYSSLARMRFDLQYIMCNIQTSYSKSILSIELKKFDLSNRTIVHN